MKLKNRFLLIFSFLFSINNFQVLSKPVTCYVYYDDEPNKKSGIYKLDVDSNDSISELIIYMAQVLLKVDPMTLSLFEVIGYKKTKDKPITVTSHKKLSEFGLLEFEARIINSKFRSKL